MAHAQQTMLLQLLFAVVAAGVNDCITTSSIRDYTLIGHSYSISSGKSLLTCVISCDRDQHCYSINYKVAFKTCELSNATRFSHPENFAFSSDAVYLDHLSRHLGSCKGDWPCRNKGKCVNVAADPGFLCLCQHSYIPGDICAVCRSPPVGMQDGRILDQQLTALSEGMWLNLRVFKPRDARLWQLSTSWVSSVIDRHPWIQISFAPEIELISGIATQGNPSHDWWTTSYTLKYTIIGKTWRDYKSAKETVKVFLGNLDRNRVMKHELSPFIKASLLRVLPRTKYGRSALRFELYGCTFIEK